MSTASRSSRLLDLQAHLLGPRLRAEDAHPQRAGARVDALPLELVQDRQHVGRGDHDDLGPEVRDELDLARGHPARGGDHGAPEPLRAVMRAQPAGEQAVAVGDVHLVARPAPGGEDRAGHDGGPDVDVALGVAHDGGFPGGPAGGVQPPQPLLRHREHAERVVVAQVVLAGGGELLQVGELAAVAGVHAGRVERLPVEGHVSVGVPQRPPQPLQLAGLQLVPAQPLVRGQLAGGGAKARGGHELNDGAR